MKYSKLIWNIRVDIVSGVLVTLIPFLVYSHLFFDASTNKATFLGFSFQTHFASLKTYAWYLSIKIIPLILVITWYFTERRWYKHFILSPIFLFIYTFLNHHQFGVDTFFVAISWVNLFTVILFLLILFIINQLYFRKLRDIEFHSSLMVLARGKLKYANISKIVRSLINREDDVNAITKYSKMAYITSIIKKILNTYYYRKVNENSRTKVPQTVIPVLLLLIPFLFHIFHLAPKNIDSILLFGRELDAKGFYDFHSMAWYVSLKLSVILPLAIWYFSTNEWWKYAIISPLFLFSFQLWEGIFMSHNVADESGYIQAIPLCIGIIFIIVCITHFLRYTFKYEKLQDLIIYSIDEKIKELGVLPDYFNDKRLQLREFRSSLVKENKTLDYLRSLLNLRLELMSRLQD